MSEPVSSRAQAILDAVERAAAEHSAAARGVARPVSPPPAPAPTPEDAESLATPPSRSVATDRLLALVDETVAAIDSTEARLEELKRDIDALSPHAPAPPVTAEELHEPGHEPEPEPEPDRVDGPAPEGSPLPPTRPLSTAARPLPPRGAVRRQSEEPVADTPDAPVENLNSTARLVAIEMAVSGGTRLQVEKRLHEEFGIADTRPIADDVFGPDTAPGTRMPWGRRP